MKFLLSLDNHLLHSYSKKRESGSEFEMLSIEGPFKVIQLELETHRLTLAGGVEGAGSVPFPRGKVSDPLVSLAAE